MNRFGNYLKCRMRIFPSVSGVVLALAFGVCGAGCGSKGKEKEPIVPVKVTTVRRAAIEQTVSAEAVVFPRQQAVVMAKITSPIKKFLVQRGSRVRKGQLLAVLENADLSAAAEQGKGELEQAQAGYSTTTGSSLPEQIQKAELDAAAAKAAFDAQQKDLRQPQGIVAAGSPAASRCGDSGSCSGAGEDAIGSGAEAIGGFETQRRDGHAEIGFGSTGGRAGKISGCRGAIELLGNSQPD